MNFVFSTDQVHPRDRFDLWHSVACKSLVDHDSRPDNHLKFDADIETGSLGHIELVLFHNSPMQISHTARHISHARSDHLFVCRQVSGSIFLDQGGREVLLDAGDMTLLDPLLPYDGRFSEGSKTLVLKIPRRELEARVGKTGDMTCSPVCPRL